MPTMRDLLQKSKVFAGWSDAELSSLEEEAQLQPFAEQELIAGGNTPIQSVYLVLSGKVRLVLYNDSEEEVTIHYHGPGEMFGWAGLFGSEEFPLHFFGLEKGDLLRIPYAVLLPLLQLHPERAMALAELLANRLFQVYREYTAEFSASAKGVDRYPIRLKAGDIMSRNAVTCSPDITALEAAKLMSLHNIGSLVILDTDSSIRGIITDKDLVTKIMAEGKDPATNTIEPLVTRNPVTISQDAFYYEALLQMLTFKISHLPVVEKNRLAGILTMKDLLDAKSHNALALSAKIERASERHQLPALAEAAEQLIGWMESEGLRPSEIARAIGGYEDRITRKVIRLAERELEAAGFGQVPVPYCWLTMGSGGRLEQPKRTDQDNALIYRDPRPDTKTTTDDYFRRLSEQVNNILADCGLPFCPGGVMASRQLWRKPLSEWKEEVAHWIMEPKAQEVRNLTIFLDFRPVYGTFELAHELRLRILYLTQNIPSFLHQLVMDDARNPVHLGLLDRGEINLKARLGVHFINAIRILAFRHGLPQVNSGDRLKALLEQGAINREDFEMYAETYETILQYKVNGIENVDLGRATKTERNRLKKAFQAVRKLQQLVLYTYRAEGLPL